MYNFSIMRAEQSFPGFDDRFPELNRFILDQVGLYTAGKINSWEDLETSVRVFFNPARMEQIESLVPGWKKMASYGDGTTLVHVMCVFLGLFMLPEFRSMSASEQNLMKWIILFHDLGKDMKDGKRDPIHGFRSAATAAKTLPNLGFEVNPEYSALIASWSAYTAAAIRESEDGSEAVQDNRRLPEILSGIDRLFGSPSSAALITKIVLLHMSVHALKDWPPSAPLSDTEISTYFDRVLISLLKVMMLADNEGWSMFYPEIRAQQRHETLGLFERLEEIIA
jgi:hypothetical protein